MRRRLAAWVATLLLAAILLPAGALAGQEEGIPWLTLEDAYTMIHYGAGYEADARQVQSWLNDARAINARVLGATLSQKAKIYLYPSQAAFPQGEELKYARYGPGVAEIHGLTPSLNSPSARQSYPRIMTHEWAHLVTNEMETHMEVTPQWFTEGLADYVSLWGSGREDWIRQESRYDTDLKAAALRGELNTFSVGDLYVNGAQAVRFLFETFGPEKVTSLVRLNSGDFQADIHQALDVTWLDLHEQWLHWVSRKFDVPLDRVQGGQLAQQIPIRATRYNDKLITVPTPKAAPVPTPVLEPLQVIMQVGSREYRSGSESRTAIVAPYVLDGTTVVPLRAVAEALGAGVGWDAATQSITITLPAEGAAPGGASGKEGAADTGIITGTGEGGQYIWVDDPSLVTPDDHGVPRLDVHVLMHDPATLPELDQLVDAGSYAFTLVEFYPTPAEVERRIGLSDCQALVVASIRMEQAAGGRWRSRWPIIIRPVPGAEFRVFTPESGLHPANWNYSTNP